MNSIVALKMPRKIVPKNVVDMALEHCIPLGIKIYGEDVVYCKYCDEVVSGGFYRFVCHLTGMEKVEACKGVGDEVRKEMLEIHTTLQEINNLEKRKANEEVVGCSRESFKRRRVDSQASDNNKNMKDSKEETCRAIARFFYKNVIPLDEVESNEFITMCDMISRHDVGFEPPSTYEIRGKYLTDEIKLTMEALEEHRAMWKITGCTIMVDAWTDQKRRNILNILVNSPIGTFFLKSIDASVMLKSPEKLYKMMDDIVEEVGEENVVQIVTDNTDYYKAAGEKLMEKRTRLYWTPCATQCILMILEDFEKKIAIHGETLKKCVRITRFIYSDASLIKLLWQFTNENLFKESITGCHHIYLFLCCLHENKGPLTRMFTSKKWNSCKFAETMDGKSIKDLVLDKKFWKNVGICYKGVYPLLEVLRLVSSVEEQPAMGFIYEAMEKAKEDIRRSVSKESSIPLLAIINERWDEQPHSPLHAAGYFLNPQFHYSPEFRDDIKVKRGLHDCIKRMVVDPKTIAKIENQLDDFDTQENDFGHPVAVVTADEEIPPFWWLSVEIEEPELQKFAFCILCLACSSYGGEHNRKAFEMVRAKRGVHLTKTDNDVLFVMANSKLVEKMRADDNEDIEGVNVDDLDLDTPCVKHQDDVGVADLHDENANGDRDED